MNRSLFALAAAALVTGALATGALVYTETKTTAQLTLDQKYRAQLSTLPDGGVGAMIPLADGGATLVTDFPCVWRPKKAPVTDCRRRLPSNGKVVDFGDENTFLLSEAVEGVDGGCQRKACVVAGGQVDGEPKAWLNLQKDGGK
jgi:hypothetical protein